MNKLFLGFVMVAIIVAALATTGVAYAQTGEPPYQAAGANGQGGGFGRQGGMRGANLQGTKSGILHDDLVTFYAEKLGLPVEELNTRLANGETMAQIAAAAGFDAVEFRSLMVEARSAAINAAVQSGELTQDQADRMLQQGARMGGRGRGAGAGVGLNANPNCPYVGQTAP